MMNQLISFETALLAKEKGFQRFNNTNEINGEFHFYDTDGKLESGYYKNGSGSKYGAMINDRKIGAIYSNACEAPTQSLLQKWLRDIHDINIIVTSSNVGWHYSFSLNIDSFDWKAFDTYELALEEGLKKALNEITCKNKE